MLDRRCSILLNTIVNECDNFTYKVLEMEALRLSFPQYMEMTDEDIMECLKILSDREYISVRYQDERAVCVCPLNKGRLVSERQIDDEIESNRKIKNYLKYSFIGAFSGGFIVALIMLIIFLVRGG